MASRSHRIKFAGPAAAPALMLAAGSASAGGPLFVDETGDFFLWSTAQPITYRTDGGNLSSQVTGAEAQARVDQMFDTWQNVPSSSIAYTRAGPITAVAGFSDGDVNTEPEFNAVSGSCDGGNQSPIIYDVDGSLFEALGQDSAVIGFAGACALNGTGQIVSGIAVMNGIFQDGVDNGVNLELTELEFDAAFVHEFGHFSGLDHSQVNLNCLVNGCGNDDLAGLPTMFPFLMGAEQRTLSTDDVAWISFLYPQGGGGGFAATHGRISGVVYFTDGESHAQLVNVIARRVDAGGNEDRRNAVSSVSGYRFRFVHGNSVTGDGPSGSGSSEPAHIGLFEIPVPTGSYTLEVEGIHPDFVDGSSVGPGVFNFELPGVAPAPSAAIAVSAGELEAGHDVILIDSLPRFDDFETAP
ncbi:MAG TPA: hypothetical protein VFU77_06555 [Steroidobacteraceae bacterium]|nr:hypothetical protein [Steroidobacteraceae bacterium]